MIASLLLVLPTPHVLPPTPAPVALFVAGPGGVPAFEGGTVADLGEVPVQDGEPEAQSAPSEDGAQSAPSEDGAQSAPSEDGAQSAPSADDTPAVPTADGAQDSESAQDPETPQPYAGPERTLGPDETIGAEELLTPTDVVAVQSMAANANATSSAAAMILTGEELMAVGAPNLPTAIGLAGGVWVQQTNLGGGSAFLRGLTGNQVLLMVDGVRLNDSTTRFGPNQSLNGIDPITVDFVEIIRGPGSVLYGSDAIGGVIHVHTRRRAPVLGGGEAGVKGGLLTQVETALGGARGSAELSGATKTDAWEVVLSGWNWDDVTAGGGSTQEYTGYDGGSFFGAWEHQFSKELNLRFTATYFSDDEVPRTDRMVPGYGQTEPSDEQYYYEDQDRQRYLLSLTDETEGFADRAEYRIFYKQYDETRRRQSFGSDTLRYEDDKVQTLGAAADWRKALSDDHLLTWGLLLETDSVDSSRTDTTNGVDVPMDGEYAPNSQYSSLGIFLQDEIFALDPVDLVLGVRYSYYDWSADAFEGQPGSTAESGNFDALTGSITAGGNIASDTRLTGKVASGFRAPNLAELAKDGTFGSGVELANADLEPEKSLTGELGVDVQKGRWGTGFSVYYTEIDDIVGRTLVTPGSGGSDSVYVRDNQGSVELYGFDWIFRHELGAVGTPWTFLANAIYTEGTQYDSTVDPATGTQPRYDVPYRRIPPLHGYLGLDWRPRRSTYAVKWATLRMHAAASQDQLSPDDVTDPRIDPNGTASWVTLNLDFGGKLGRSDASTWNVGLHNITDTDYRVHGSGYNAPGINLVLGLTWRP